MDIAVFREFWGTKRHHILSSLSKRTDWVTSKFEHSDVFFEVSSEKTHASRSLRSVFFSVVDLIDYSEYSSVYFSGFLIDFLWQRIETSNDNVLEFVRSICLVSLYSQCLHLLYLLKFGQFVSNLPWKHFTCFAWALILIFNHVFGVYRISWVIISPRCF